MSEDSTWIRQTPQPIKALGFWTAEHPMCGNSSLYHLMPLIISHYWNNLQSDIYPLLQKNVGILYTIVRGGG